MSFFSNLKTRWKAMPTSEKIKLVVSGVCDIGADLLAGMMLGRLVPADEKKWKKVAMTVTAGGLGMWAGRTASNEINSCIDMITQVKDMEKEQDVKEEEKEEEE